MPQSPSSPNEMETRWSLVARATSGQAVPSVKALDELMHIYLPVLNRFLTQYPQIDAHTRDDLVQGFVTSRILDKQILTQADPGKGRFRNFLLKSFQNYLRDEFRRGSSQRRSAPGGDPLSFEDVGEVAGTEADPERLFRQAWARQVVAEAVNAMEAECQRKDRADVWSVFDTRILQPALAGAEPEPYPELVERLSLSSPAQASNLLITARRMFQRHLEQVVRDTVQDPAQAEDELRELKIGL